MAYSNDADGYCCECGEETADEWHRYCGRCYAEENGWMADLPPWRPDPSAIAQQREDRERVTLLRLTELLASHQRSIEELHARVAVLERPRDRRAA